MHPGGFEPPTARFVAEYSIQLSYGCIGKTRLEKTRDGASGGFEPPTARFVAEYSIQLSYGCIGETCFTADIDIATKATSSNMVHPGGFEPPTARFVAEYSIQLSYGCKWR